MKHSFGKRTLGLAAVLALLMSGCSQEAEDGGDDNTLTVWTLENLPDRLDAQEEIAAQFTEQTGVEVDIVGIDQDQYVQLLTSAAAAGDLPDVIGALELAGVRTLSANELIDSEAATAVVDELGTETFSQRALELTRDGDEQLSVPSDGWTQLLIYRKDLFDQAGLPEPNTYENIERAAEELDSSQTAGFVGATAAGNAFTQQTFEHMALGNNCEMVDDQGSIKLQSEQCVGSFDFYDRLIENYSVAGTQDVDTTRASYFGGQAAMVVWSSFILDELAGLREDALPTCGECEDGNGFLAENSGIVTSLKGPDGAEPAQFGEVVSWAMTDGAADSAQDFVKYMMSDAYMDWIGFAPEGKIPARTGSAPGETDYIDEWENLPVGVDTRAPLKDFYSAEDINDVKTSVDSIDRWAIPQGQGELLGAALGELPVPEAITAMTSGQTTPEEAAEQAADELANIQESLQ